MPRISAESRSASVWRAGARHPQAPRNLSREAKKVWHEIVNTRPADFFRPGSLHLLETFCEAAVAQRTNLGAMVVAPEDDDVVERVKKLGVLLATLASKLRITVQAEVVRDSKKLDETEPDLSDRGDLLGGGALADVKSRRRRRDLN